jgi:PAS domain S-box-containing protein
VVLGDATAIVARPPKARPGEDIATLSRHDVRTGPTHPPAPHTAALRHALRTPTVALLILALLLPVGLLGASAWIAWRLAWSTAATEVARSAESIAEYGKRVLTLHAVAADSMDTLLRGLSDAEIRANQARLHQEMQLLIGTIPGVVKGVVADRQGGVLTGARLMPPHEVRGSVARMEAFQALATPGAPPLVVGWLEMSLMDGTPFFMVARRRAQSGNRDLPADGFDGLVSMSVRTDHLAVGLNRLSAAPHDSALLLRADGALLARSDGWAAPAHIYPTLRAALDGHTGAMLTDSQAMLDGQRHIAHFRGIEGWPVYAVVARPHAAIHAAWRAAVAGQLAIGLPALAILLATALAVLRAQRRLAEAKLALEARVLARTAELAASEARLSEALEAGRVFAVTHEPGPDIVARSVHAAAILGLPPDRATRDRGSAYLAAILPDDRPALDAALAGLSPAAPRYAARYRWRRPDGRIVWLQDTGSATFGPNGQLLRLASLSRDITTEAEAEQALREKEVRLRAAAEGAGLGTYEIDFAQNTIWCDARAAEIWGATVPAGRWVRLDGPEWAHLDATIHPEDRPAFEAAWQAVVSGRAPSWSVETRLRRSDGSWAWDWCHGIVAARDPASGAPLRLVGVARDVTAQRQMEADLRQGQKLQALGQLAGGIAHDFNNVLQAVSGAAATIAREANDSTAIRRRARLLTEAVARGAAITGRLLAFARRTDWRREEVRPRELLFGLREMLQPMLGPRIAIRIEADPRLPPFLADREQVQIALINLATNARDAMPEGGTLTFAAERRQLGPGDADTPLALAPGAYLRIAVRDTGTGMDAATLARVTEPFFTTKPPGRGTGLGLPLVRGLAEQSGGAFTLDSMPGRGTTACLWLPELATAPDERAAGPARTRLLQGLSLLVVDDDPLVREALVAQLEVEGCQVLARPDAATALAALEDDVVVDVLVTDLAMPGQDGLSLIGAARRRRPGLPCLLLTGQPEEEEDEESFLSSLGPGPCTVLRKPVGGPHIAAALVSLRTAR